MEPGKVAPGSRRRHRSPVPTSLAYRVAVRTAVPLVPLLLRDPTQRGAHRARLGAARRLAAWGGEHRDPSRPLAWFHAPSVGEGLQARAVLAALRALRPDVQVAYTHFSPSAERFAASVGADVTDYLPYDTPGAVAAVLDALRPTLLVFAKLDLWPELASRATARGVAVALAAATVRPGSGRLRWPARSLTHPGYAALAAATAVDADDAARLVTLGTRASVVSVTGDPRVDSALGVVAATDPADPLLHLADPAHTLVAGSTWPEDEAVLLEAFALLRAEHPAARLIVVPHEPTDSHLAALDALARTRNLPAPIRLGDPRADEAPLVVVDRVGVLARLYANGSIAYVGGGFGRRGIHSVIEPAAWSRPVVVGPSDREAREVDLLRRAGGLIQLGAAGAAGALRARWSTALGSPDATAAMGRRAREALEPDRGAAGRTASLLARFLPPP